jgi:diaminohydroxyphosphoribosylaminopyrimidine deaminase / 5-amino-6-(5-phosphoribosylamino)uracil reductase
MSDSEYLARALRLAEKGLYTTHPNPRVGCVLAKSGVIVGEGYHQQTGGEHAEAMALRVAGAAAEGATAYVTLEPCSFQGRTPSCAKALINAGIKRVVAAMADPHTRNAGAGFRILRDAGIEVDTPLMEQSARQLNPGYVRKFEAGLPYVRLKLAMTLDGKTALANGKSQWITGSEARADVQKLRARSSAIVTGVQTIIDDDPRMSVRADELQDETAVLAAKVTRPIYVLDSHCRIPQNAAILANPHAVVVCCNATSRKLPVTIEQVDAASDGRVDLARFLQFLAQKDCNEVLFECGATLAGALIRDGLADELVIYVAPSLMGNDARSLLNLPEIDKMQDLFQLTIREARMVGQDIRLTAMPESRD